MPVVATQDGLPRANGVQFQRHEMDAAMVNNQFVMNAAAKYPSNAPDKNMACFLSYVATSSGTITIKDGSGNTVASGIPSPLDLTQHPMRLDGGFELTGSIVLAYGFHMKIMQDY